MRNVRSHILEDKMDEAVTHYINSHSQGESVHMDTNGLPLNVHDETGRVLTVMHPQSFSTQMCRQVAVGDQVSESGPWGEELLDPDMKLAAIMAHLQNSRSSQHQQFTLQKVPSVRDVDSTVMLDTPLRIFNGHTLDQHNEHIVVEVPALPPLPPLQQIKRCPETDWFNNKDKTTLKDDGVILQEGGSPAQQRQHSKKSLPHKKRISRKLKKNTGNTTPQQQEIVVMHCNADVPQEEILPDSYVGAAHHLDPTPAHQVRASFICQLCGEFYGEEQLKFYHHLKQHYEPSAAIIIDNAVTDLAIDKIANTCIVDNVATLPDSIVELSLENTVPKTMYQPMDKHILYTTADKTLNYAANKVQYSMAGVDKEAASMEADKPDLYDSFDKLDYYCCSKCNKSFRKQKQCEAHIKEVHSDGKVEEMGEFSEPEDLMEGIHVSVDDSTLLPHLTVDHGHVHQDHVHHQEHQDQDHLDQEHQDQDNARHWYIRGATDASESSDAVPSNKPYMCEMNGGQYCPVCPSAREQEQTNEHSNSPAHLKEEVLQRILEEEVATSEGAYQETIAPEEAKETGKAQAKKGRKFECLQCGRVFQHRNSLLYHVLVHSGKQHVCADCDKTFYTPGALKVHQRVHNDERPYKCEECGREFRQWSDLNYHKASLHSDEKLWKCEFCAKEFSRKYSLIVHRRIHTGERNYKCLYCAKTFRASSYRLSHMRIHTGDKPYKCAECGKCFRVPADLRRHKLTHDKVRNRCAVQKANIKVESKPPPDFEQHRNKTLIKGEPYKPKDCKQEEDKPAESSRSVKKIAIASTAKQSTYKSVEKKPRAAKKNSSKKAPPNVTVQNEEYASKEVFDTREINGQFNKYSESDSAVFDKDKDGFSEQMLSYKDQKVTDDRDFATLRPMIGRPGPGPGPVGDVSHDKYPVRMENTDGKMAVYTQVEKNGQLGLDREVKGDGLQGEVIENCFLERLTALYNIPAV